MNRVKESGKRVVVGLTGKLASCIAALLLKKQGMDVIGISIVTNSSENFSPGAIIPNCHIQNLEPIQQFCQEFNIPFYATDAKSRFDYEVFDEVIGKKIMGEANNSCFNCTAMKFAVLFEKMKGLNADYIATGHFCKVQENISNKNFFIHSGSDAKSDQSYLLAGIHKDILEKLILPLGDLSLEEVKKIGKKFGVKFNDLAPNQFCFEDRASYYDHGIKRVPPSFIEPGQVLDLETGAFLGDHMGIFEYKMGQGDLSFTEGVFLDKKFKIVDYDSKNLVVKIGQDEDLSHQNFQLVALELAQGIDRQSL